MLKKKDKLIPTVVGHVPRETSRFVSYFIHGGRLEGIVLSPECKSSPIPKGGLEIILKVKFSIEESCSKVLKRLKELIDEYYDPLSVQPPSNPVSVQRPSNPVSVQRPSNHVSVQRPSKPTEAPELEAKESSTEILELDDDFVIFIDDSENEEEDV